MARLEVIACQWINLEYYVNGINCWNVIIIRINIWSIRLPKFMNLWDCTIVFM